MVAALSLSRVGAGSRSIAAVFVTQGGDVSRICTARVAVLNFGSTGGTSAVRAIAAASERWMRGALAALTVVITAFGSAALSAASAQSDAAWGAIYFSKEGYAVGATWNKATQRSAILEAREICKKYGRNCEFATEFQTNECGAIAAGPDGWAADYASSKGDAENKAMDQCGQESANCKIIGVACNNGLGKAWFERTVNKGRSAQTDDQGGSDESSLASELQSELKRLGCLGGRVDGIWGSGSRRALARFADQAGLSLDSEPTQEALEAAKNADSARCRVATAPAQRRTGTVRRRVRCSRVRFAYTRGNTCACAGGRVFTGRRCVWRRRW